MKIALIYDKKASISGFNFQKLQLKVKSSPAVCLTESYHSSSSMNVKTLSIKAINLQFVR